MIQTSKSSEKTRKYEIFAKFPTIVTTVAMYKTNNTVYTYRMHTGRYIAS